MVVCRSQAIIYCRLDSLCRKEIYYTEGMGVQDFWNPILQQGDRFRCAGINEEDPDEHT